MSFVLCESGCFADVLTSGGFGPIHLAAEKGFDAVVLALSEAGACVRAVTQCLVGWLIGWLSGWLIGWLSAWLSSGANIDLRRSDGNTALMVAAEKGDCYMVQLLLSLGRCMVV